MEVEQKLTVKAASNNYVRFYIHFFDPPPPCQTFCVRQFSFCKGCQNFLDPYVGPNVINEFPFPPFTFFVSETLIPIIAINLIKVYQTRKLL